MKFEDIVKKNIAVHCETEHEAAELMQKLEAFDSTIVWKSGKKPTYWTLYSSNICYRVNADTKQLECGTINIFRSAIGKNAEIISFKDLTERLTDNSSFET